MDWRDFAIELASVARNLLEQDSVEGTLSEITAAAVRLVPGCEAAGILRLSGGTVRSYAVTSPLVQESDHLQERFGEGPCFDAAKVGHPVFRIHDMTTETTRWRRYAPEARALGIGSMMGFLLYTNEQDLGALDMYSPKAGAFTEDCETAGWLLASHAAVAFAESREHSQLAQAVQTRGLIGEAMGVLMASHHLSQDEAFDVLRRYSQENNIKLREVARRTVDRGGLEKPFLSP
ncbi:GAF and ANTAR domain-containing protein [Streptomyces sp. NPDC102467]|uniref:GAF and ANTAR domain-containing protein n=1 Tax=Streptomyces sp. NPDC102467 TaxID=3366179 RepID=UPI0037F4F36C